MNRERIRASYSSKFLTRTSQNKILHKTIRIKTLSVISKERKKSKVNLIRRNLV